MYVNGSNGVKIFARALIDQCSQVSLISENNLSQRLILGKRKVHIPISGIEMEKNIANSVTQFMISPRLKSSFSCCVEAAVLPRITFYKPPFSKKRWKFEYFDGFVLADPHFDKSSTIDLLLGASIHELIVNGEIVKGQYNY